MKPVCPLSELLSARLCSPRAGNSPRRVPRGQELRQELTRPGSTEQGMRGQKPASGPSPAVKRLPAGEAGDRNQDFFPLRGNCCLGRQGWLARLGASTTPHPVFAAGKSRFHLCQGEGSPIQGSLAVGARGELSPTRTGRVRPRHTEDSAPCTRASWALASGRPGVHIWTSALAAK